MLFHVCIGEIQILFYGPKGNPKNYFIEVDKMA